MAERSMMPAGPARAEPARVLEAMRAEASRYYHTNAAEARRIASRAIACARRFDEPVALGWAHRTMAESMLFSGRFREAETSYGAAAESWRKAGRTALLGQLLVGRIHVLALLGRMDAVESAAREARKHLEAARDRVYLAKLAMNLGNLHFQGDRYAEALAEYERAGDLFSQLGLRDQTVLALEVNRAVALTQLDRDTEALALFDRLERECRRRGHQLLQAQVWMNRAYVHFLRADFDLALRDLASATAYFRETDHQAFLSTCLLNKAEIYHQLNLHGDSSGLAGDAAAVFGREELRYDQALALFQHALARLAGGEGVSLAEVGRALSLFDRENNPARVALTRLLQAEVLRRRGRLAEAAPLLDQAREEFRRRGLVRWEATAVLLQNALKGRSVPAVRRIGLLREVLKRLPGRIYPLQEQQLLDALGRAQEEAGLPAEALRSYARSVARFESLRLRVPTEDSKIAFLGDKTHLYDRLLRLELDRPRPRPARLLEWMERARAQSLWDRMRHPSGWKWEESPKNGTSAARRRISWLHARVSRLELGTEAERVRAARLRRDLVRAEQEWSRGLRAQGEAATRRAPSGAREGKPDDWRELLRPEAIAASLPDGWGYLAYHLGRGVALALAVTRSGIVWRELVPDLAERVARLADRLDFQWGAASLVAARGAQIREAALAAAVRPGAAPDAPPRPGAPETLLLQSTDVILSELYKLLWEPLEDAGLPEGLNWMISPHGAVHRIPLAALRDGRGYLAERLDIALVPSVATWRALPGSRTRGKSRAWIAGVISPTLPAIGRELERVRSLLNRFEVQAELNPTRDELRRRGRGSALIHLAAHGSLRRDNPSYSFIELSDGPLFVHDLSGFRLPGSTVVLTACSSGRGAAPAGDEWIGLARGFIQAGASTVVASLWPIEDTATETLIDLFYQGFAAGLPAPRALGAAMRGMIREWPHPWHWASFAVLGGVPGARNHGGATRRTRPAPMTNSPSVAPKARGKPARRPRLVWS